jgi:hypothetical protein
MSALSDDFWEHDLHESLKYVAVICNNGAVRRTCYLVQEESFVVAMLTGTVYACERV